MDRTGPTKIVKFFNVLLAICNITQWPSCSPSVRITIHA
jgi:hypothetical protein